MSKKFYIEDRASGARIDYCITPREGYTEITDETVLKTLYKKQYNERTIAGIDFYNDFRSRLMIGINNQTINPNDAFAVEAHLSSVKDNLITGNWLTAQFVCQNTTLLLPLYDQALKDEILLGINNYINDNY